VDDTAPAIAAMVLDGYRKMTPSDRLRRMSALTVDLRRLVIADLLRRQPHATPTTVRAELARRFLPPELAARVTRADADR
jgi:hypothetical protein